MAQLYLNTLFLNFPSRPERKYRPHNLHHNYKHIKVESGSQVRPNTVSDFTASRHFSVLKPKIPPKKLNEQPRFYMSIEKKRSRILNSLKNSAFVDYQSQRKISRSTRQLELSQNKQDIQDSKSQLKDHEHRSISHFQRSRGPHAKLTLQMLLEHRRPSLSSNLQKYHKMALQ